MTRFILLLVFFASGFVALLDEVIWQRMLILFSGIDVHSATIVVAAFMAGLGVGNLAGGYLADRLSPWGNLALFLAAELAIGLFGLASTTIFYDYLYQQHHELSRSSVMLALVLWLSLLWPTFFMGISLPLLAKALSKDAKGAAPVIASLYALNTLGAALGAATATWILMPSFGLEPSLRIGAMVNFACAGSVLLVLLFRRLTQPATESAILPEPLPADPAPVAAGNFGFAGWLLIYALSGFIALSLEIVWFRLLGVMLKSITFTFGTLLALYLGGLGIGSVIGTFLVSRSRRPMITFLLAQAGIALYGTVVCAVLFSLERASPLAALKEYLGGVEPHNVWGTLSSIRNWLGGRSLDASALFQLRQFIQLYFLLPGALIAVPTLLMGLSFPYLQKAAQTDAAKLGRRVGALQTANIVGGIAGTFLTGLVALDFLGSAVTLKVLLALGATFGALWWWVRFGSTGLRRLAPASAALLAGIPFLFLPGSAALWAKLHGAQRDQIVFTEDSSGVSLVKSDAPELGGPIKVFANGLSHSWIPFGGVHTALGALPIFLHPNPRRIAVIGLGSGDTAFSAGGRRDIESITCIEVIHSQLDTLRRLSERRTNLGLGRLLSDSRIQHEKDDGRVWILRSNERFDIIEADALQPFSAYAGNMFSREYFALLKDHLEPGGFAVTWIASDRVVETLRSVFPYVTIFGDVAIGTLQPIAIDRAQIQSQIDSEAVRSYYQAAGLEIQNLLSLYLDPAALTLHGPDEPRPTEEMVNSDLFPRDEFELR